MVDDASRKVQDEDRLAEMGYKQELNRDWSMLHNFGVSFSIIVGDIVLFQHVLLSGVSRHRNHMQFIPLCKPLRTLPTLCPLYNPTRLPGS